MKINNLNYISIIYYEIKNYFNIHIKYCVIFILVVQDECTILLSTRQIPMISTDSQLNRVNLKVTLMSTFENRMRHISFSMKNIL